MTQKEALKALKEGHNIFLTGAAGSGKTFLLNKYIKYLKKAKIGVAVTASTGIAATHMNGITIHSWSGIGIRDGLTDADFKKIARKPRIRRRMKETKVLIIDEISMLHAHQLDMVDAVCRRFIDKTLPFGGLQVILCGDFFQLPPIQRDSEKEIRFVFSSDAWQSAEMKICYLEEQHRQQNDGLIEVLNNIRSVTTSESDIDILSSRIVGPSENQFQPTRLFSHNIDVDFVNNLELDKLSGTSMVYDMKEKGVDSLVETLKNGCLAPSRLILKEGAHVMFVRNNFDLGYVNGTTGIVEGFDEERRMPLVRTYSGELLVASPESWVIEEGDTILASITQIPLRLAWAITIHKSQGMSLDTVEADLSKSFEFGMGYVALSRVRTLGGLRLLGLNELALEVDPDILFIDNELRDASDRFSKEIMNKK